jgi:predicted MFS family arabinose efflux permease
MPAERRAINTTIGFLALLRLVLNTAFRFVYPFLPAISRGLGIPLAQGGFLVSARWIGTATTPLAIQFAGGGEARRKTFRIALGMFISGLVVSVAFGAYWAALAGFAMYGLGKSMFDVTVHSYISDRVPYAERAKKMGYIELSWGGALLVGAPAAGWLIEKMGWEAPFWVLAVLALVGLAFSGLLLDVDRPLDPEAPRRLKLHKASVALLAASALFSLAAEVLFVVFGAWLEDSFSLSLSALGLSAVVLGIAELGGEGFTVLVTDRLGKKRSVLGGLTISIVAYSLMGAFATSQVLGLAMFAIALFGFEWTIVSSIPLASGMHETGRAKYLALGVVAMGLARSLGAAVAPALFTAGGLTYPVILAVAADVLAVVVLIAWVEEPDAQSR